MAALPDSNMGGAEALALTPFTDCQDNSRLYVGGSGLNPFDADPAPAGGIFAHRNGTWYALNGGIDCGPYGGVFAMAVYGGDLYVGGSFSTVDGSCTKMNLAKWTCGCIADYNGDGFSDGIDYDLFNADFEDLEPCVQMLADLNHDGFVDGIDSDIFNDHYENGC